MTIHDVLIIGGGPAGLAAAIQLKRYGIDAPVFEGGLPGGLLHNACRVENYPGFPRGVTGPRLAGLIEAQARRAGVTIRAEKILRLEWDGETFWAASNLGEYAARLVVVASGTKPRPLKGLDIPAALQERVAYDLVSLGNIAGQRIVIVGAGDAAFDYAINLSQQNDVIILNRGEQVKCLPLLWQRAQACPRISYRPNTRVARLLPATPGGMTVECSSPAGKVDFQAHSLLAAVGRDPQLDFTSDTLREQAASLETRGILHFVGDVKNGIFRQAAIASGDGCLAAMRITRALMEEFR